MGSWVYFFLLCFLLDQRIFRALDTQTTATARNLRNTLELFFNFFAGSTELKNVKCPMSLVAGLVNSVLYWWYRKDGDGVEYKRGIIFITHSKTNKRKTNNGMSYFLFLGHVKGLKGIQPKNILLTIPARLPTYTPF